MNRMHGGCVERASPRFRDYAWRYGEPSGLTLRGIVAYAPTGSKSTSEAS